MAWPYLFAEVPRTQVPFACWADLLITKAVTAGAAPLTVRGAPQLK